MINKLEQNFTISGKVVEPQGEVGNLTVYSEGLGEEEVVLHFINEDSESVGSIKLEAWMSQGCGLISDITVTNNE